MAIELNHTIVYSRDKRSGATFLPGSDDGRGVSFDDPSGHILEIITRPYGAGRG